MDERRTAMLDRGQDEPPRSKPAEPAGSARQLPLLPGVGERDRSVNGGGRSRFAGIAPGWLAGQAGGGQEDEAALDPLAVRIGEAIAAQRQELGMSQAALALAIGCDRSAVSRWEMGLRLPSVPHLVALGRALGCGAGALLPE